MEKILELDQAILLAINSWNSPFADSIMLFASAIPVWIPLYIIIATLFFFPKWYGKNSYLHEVSTNIPVWAIGLLGVAAIGICFGLNDQISVFLKETVGRPRPGYDPSLDGIVRLIDGRGGVGSFVSGHAANTVGLAVLTSLIFRQRYYTIAMTLWALTISYSRIYLGKHYPFDVIGGIILGTALAFAVYYLWKLALRTISKNKIHAI